MQQRDLLLGSAHIVCQHQLSRHSDLPVQMSRHHSLLVACIAAVLAYSAAKGTLNDSEYIAAPRQPVKRPSPAVNGLAVPLARQHTGKPYYRLIWGMR